jgi:phosphohistidine swiveling domain-containing protein
MALQRDTLVWIGTGASAGVVTGTARIIYTEKDFTNVNSQDILVARHATPDLYPSLVRAQAAICETGGRLCHLAVLAREMGKPCVTGLPKILDSITPGARIRVDGTKGTVEVLTSQQKGKDYVNSYQVKQDSTELVPIIQFGTFSKTFEYVDERFDIETIIRTAALVSLPIAFSVGTPWDFSLSKNQVLVGQDKLFFTKSTIVKKIENGAIKIDELHQKYFDICTWMGWIDISSQKFDKALLKLALNNYVFINQVTWLACIVKEELTERYREFLAEKLPGLHEENFNQIFLNSLIMPGHSYILRCHLEQDNQNVWHGSFSQDKTDADKIDSQVSSIQAIEDANSLKANTLEKLRLLLDEESFDRVLCYISMIASLVDLTERKNTDLYKCGKSLFAKTSILTAINDLFGLETTSDGVANVTIENRKILIQKVLASFKK